MVARSPLGLYLCMLKVIASTICALLLCTISACGGDSPKPKPLASDSASSTLTTAPTIPGSVKQKNKAGVRAAVEAFVAAWNHAAATGETGPLEAISTPECLKCVAAAKVARETYARGGRYVDTDWSVNKYRLKGFENEIGYVELYVNVSPNSYVASDGASPQHKTGGKNLIHFLQLAWTENAGWRVIALDPELNP